MGCNLWGHTESDTTEVTQQHMPLCIGLLSLYWSLGLIKEGVGVGNRREGPPRPGS